MEEEEYRRRETREVQGEKLSGEEEEVVEGS